MKKLTNGKIKETIPRQSNIELLRIVAMLIIIAHHFAVHGNFAFSTVTVNRLWIQFIAIGGKIGVNIFVLISGYFLVSSELLKVSKAIKLWVQIFTYSVVIFLIFVLFGAKQFSLKALMQHCFPITFSQWGFASNYFVLYLLSPYLNKLLNAFDKKQYQGFLLLLLIFWCVIPTLTGQTFQSNTLLWFVFLYAFSGYLRIFSPKTNIKSTAYLLLSFIFILLTFLSSAVQSRFFWQRVFLFYDMQKIPIFAVSVLMFVGFLKINIGYQKIINIISSATFGVYLIHDNEYMRSFLWKNVFRNASYSKSNFLIPYSLSVIAVIFVSCSIMELARIYLLEKHYMKAVNSLADAFDRLKEKLFSLNITDKKR